MTMNKCAWPLAFVNPSVNQSIHACLHPFYLSVIHSITYLLEMIKCGITKLRVSNKRQLNQIHVVAFRHLFHAYCNCLRRLRRLASCPSLSVNGGYSEWSGFSVCTRQCNGGVKVRSRTCSNPFPQHGGQDCQGLGPSSESRHCNTHPCPGNSKKKRRMKRVTHLIGQYANRTINIKSKETSILIFVKIYSLCVP